MSINKFKIEEEVSGKSTKLIFSGNLNEHAVLSVPKHCDQLSIISINLRDVSYINSVGTRSWCVWIKKIPSTTQIIFEECPMLFVKAFSYVSGFLPNHAIVNSFYVPYVSEDSEESKIVLYRRGEHYDESGQLKVVSVLDSSGKAMELDVLNKYFAFLKR